MDVTFILLQFVTHTIDKVLPNLNALLAAIGGCVIAVLIGMEGGSRAK